MNFYLHKFWFQCSRTVLPRSRSVSNISLSSKLEVEHKNNRYIISATQIYLKGFIHSIWHTKENVSYLIWISFNPTNSKYHHYMEAPGVLNSFPHNSVGCSPCKNYCRVFFRYSRLRLCGGSCGGWEGTCRVLNLALQSTQSNLETQGTVDPWWEQRECAISVLSDW
jgi:hypothetical protein